MKDWYGTEESFDTVKGCVNAKRDDSSKVLDKLTQTSYNKDVNNKYNKE